MKISNISVVSVPVKDAEVAATFYKDVLGFVVINDVMMGPNMRWLELAPEGSQAHISLVSWYDNMPPGSVQGLCLEVADATVMHAEMTAKGISVTTVVKESFGTMFNVQDPDGNDLLIIQTTPTAA